MNCKIEKNFINDESEIVFRAESGELRLFMSLGVVAGGIVAMNDNGGARARSDGAFKGGKIELPAVIIEERIADEADIVEAGEKVEERIAWSWNQHFVAGVAEQAEEIGISFTGARGEK